MKITYVYHSCFVIETADNALIFDYYTHGDIIKQIINSKKHVYVFASHIHGDHFNPEIFNWKTDNCDINYILSYDIANAGNLPDKNTVFLSEGDIFKDESIYVKTYGSTDCGVSFWVEFDEKSIFHSGDLNNWHWNEHASEAEANISNNLFLNKLNLIKQDHSFVDIAMFPVDPRLGKDFFLGAEQFVSEIKTGLFIPMHFWEKYEKANLFKSVAEKYGSKFFTITKTGDSIRL